MQESKIDSTTLRERNRKRTHDRIVKVAAELFRTRGYDCTTMDEIAIVAEVSRATLFNYFPTKESLLVSFIEQVLEERVRPNLSAYLALQPDTFDAFRFLYVSICEHVLAVPDVDQALRRELLRSEYFGRRGQEDSSFQRIIADLLRYGQRSGVVRRDIPVEKQAAYLGALYGAAFFDAALKAENDLYPGDVEEFLLFVRSSLQAE